MDSVAGCHFQENNEVDLESSLSRYPDPASDLVIAQSSLFTIKPLPKLYDVTGKLFHQYPKNNF